MSLKRLPNGSYQVYVFVGKREHPSHPDAGKKKYVGVRGTHKEAKQLERDALTELAQGKTTGGLTIRQYAELWLRRHHGEGTRRPSPNTRVQNESNLRLFLQEFGDKPLDSIRRGEALDWSKKPGNRGRAKTVSAMFNDALDDEQARANPFANRRVKQSDERKHIAPLTEHEVDELARIALERWGPDGYGLVAKAWVLFGAWVGTRPGETFGVTWQDLDLREGLVSVRRIKGRQQTEPVVVPAPAVGAIQAMPRIQNPGGLVFPTVGGKRMQKGSLRYYWEPVRSAFRETVSPDRWRDLIDGQDDLDFYSMRHFCASLIVERGGNEYLVAAQLGNTPEVARETYIHSYKERTRDQLRGLFEQPRIVDLDAARQRRIGGDK